MRDFWASPVNMRDLLVVAGLSATLVMVTTSAAVFYNDARLQEAARARDAITKGLIDTAEERIRQEGREHELKLIDRVHRLEVGLTSQFSTIEAKLQQYAERKDREQ